MYTELREFIADAIRFHQTNEILFDLAVLAALAVCFWRFCIHTRKDDALAKQIEENTGILREVKGAVEVLKEFVIKGK